MDKYTLLFSPVQIKHGETFVSETDTEVIPKLCKFVYHRLTEKVPFPKVWHLESYCSCHKHIHTHTHSSFIMKIKHEI